MARIRTIKPEFPQSESMGRVSRDARLLFIELWTVCDDCGRTRASSRLLASLLYPYDEDAPGLIDDWLDELERENCLVRYKINGGSYLQITKWSSHQRIDRPTPSQIPPFDESSRDARESSRVTRDGSTGDRNGMEGNGREGSGEGNSTSPKARRRAQARCSPPLCKPDQVAQETWDDWLKLRRAKKAPVTGTVLASAQREAAKAGMTLEAFFAEWCARGSQGLKAEWIVPKKPKGEDALAGAI